MGCTPVEQMKGTGVRTGLHYGTLNGGSGTLIVVDGNATEFAQTVRVRSNHERIGNIGTPRRSCRITNTICSAVPSDHRTWHEISAFAAVPLSFHCTVTSHTKCPVAVVPSSSSTMLDCVLSSVVRRTLDPSALHLSRTSFLVLVFLPFFEYPHSASASFIFRPRFLPSLRSPTPMHGIVCSRSSGPASPRRPSLSTVLYYFAAANAGEADRAPSAAGNV